MAPCCCCCCSACRVGPKPRPMSIWIVCMYGSRLYFWGNEVPGSARFSTGRQLPVSSHRTHPGTLVLREPHRRRPHQARHVGRHDSFPSPLPPGAATDLPSFPPFLSPVTRPLASSVLQIQARAQLVWLTRPRCSSTGTDRHMISSAPTETTLSAGDVSTAAAGCLGAYCTCLAGKCFVGYVDRDPSRYRQGRQPGGRTLTALRRCRSQRCRTTRAGCRHRDCIDLSVHPGPLDCLATIRMRSTQGVQQEKGDIGPVTGASCAKLLVPSAPPTNTNGPYRTGSHHHRRTCGEQW